MKDKLWFWGSYGKQDIRLVRSSGNLIDKTILKDFNAKVNWQASASDMVSVLWFLGAKFQVRPRPRRLRGLCGAARGPPGTRTTATPTTRSTA